MSEPASETLSVNGLQAHLAGRVVLGDVSLSLQRGEVLGVLGRNGSGKTTLLRACLGLVPGATGQVRLAGRDVFRLSEPELAALAGYLPQNRQIGWNLPAWRVAALGLPRVPLSRAREAAVASLARVGVAGLAERGVQELSGGERARVLMARLLLTRAPVLLADEPAAGLDPDAQLQVMELLRERAREGGAVMVSLHELSLAARTCDRLAILVAGRLTALGVPAEVLTPAVLREAFSLEGTLLDTPHGLIVAAQRSSQL